MREGPVLQRFRPLTSAFDRFSGRTGARHRAALGPCRRSSRPRWPSKELETTADSGRPAIRARITIADLVDVVLTRRAGNHLTEIELPDGTLVEQVFAWHRISSARISARCAPPPFSLEGDLCCSIVARQSPPPWQNMPRSARHPIFAALGRAWSGRIRAPWPDFGLPSPPSALTHSHIDRERTPVLCSGGLGTVERAS